MAVAVYKHASDLDRRFIAGLGPACQVSGEVRHPLPVVRFAYDSPTCMPTPRDGVMSAPLTCWVRCLWRRTWRSVCVRATACAPRTSACISPMSSGAAGATRRSVLRRGRSTRGAADGLEPALLLGQVGASTAVVRLELWDGLRQIVTDGAVGQVKLGDVRDGCAARGGGQHFTLTFRQRVRACAEGCGRPAQGRSLARRPWRRTLASTLTGQLHNQSRVRRALRPGWRRAQVPPRA
jgi:hypothetical protein